MKILLLVIVTIFLAGCGNETVEITKPPVVKTVTVTADSQAQESIYSGVVKGRYVTNLSFQVGGKIISRSVEVGSRVNRGDLLMSLDAKDLLQQSNQADAGVSAALAQLNLAKSNLDRYSELFQQNAVAAATLEQFQTQYDAALAEYNSAVAQSGQSKNALGYTNLVANASGVISAVNAEVGQVVASGQTVLTLTQTQDLEVEINVPENKIASVEVNQPCTVTFWANDLSLNGTVREISPVADSSSRTFAVKISLPQSQNLNLGMTAEVTFAEKNLQTFSTLPLSAIYQTADKSQVWIVEGGKVKLKTVTVKNFLDNNVEVQGLNAGEVVVTAGVHKLREGQEVVANEKFN